MTPLDAMLSFVVAGLLTLVPGLDTALVLRSSLIRSRAYAWGTAAGIALGAMIWGVAAAVGVSALLTASQTAYRVLTLAGAAYMCWLGVSMIRRSVRGGGVAVPGADAEAGTNGAADGSPWHGLLLGAGTATAVRGRAPDGRRHPSARAPPTPARPAASTRAPGPTRRATTRPRRAGPARGRPG